MAADLRRLRAVALAAATQCLRAPVFCLVLLTALVVAGALPTFDYLAFLEKRRLVADSLLALTFCAGVFAAAVSASAAVGDELRRHTALVVLSRPVSRGAFVTGKLLGIALALGALWLPLAAAVLWGSRVAYDPYRDDLVAVRVFFAVLLAAVVLAALLNHRTGRSFGSAVATLLAVGLPLSLLLLSRGGGGTAWGLVDWTLVPAVALAWPAMVLAAAVAVAASCWLDSAPALVVTLAVFGLGLVLPSLLAGGGLSWAGGVWPDWQRFWVADALAAKMPVTWRYVAAASGYAAAYAGFLLSGAVLLLDRRELA